MKPLFRSQPLLILAALALLTLVAVGALPGNLRIWQALQNAAHAPVFFLLALIVLTLLRGAAASAPAGWRLHAHTFVICIALGIGIEVLQAFIGGDASAVDVLCDALGIAAGLAGHMFFARRQAGPGSRVTRPLLALVCLACLVVASAPLLWACAAYVHRHTQFPVLYEFHSSLDRYFLLSDVSSFNLENNSLRVQLKDEEWPGVVLDEPYPDWRGYRTLVVELRNPGPRPLPLILRVHDAAHARTNPRLLEDRYNGPLELPPLTTRQFSIPLATIQAAPGKRRMDLGRIAGIAIFGARDTAGAGFYINGVWLQ